MATDTDTDTEDEAVEETDEVREAIIAAFSERLDDHVVATHIRPGDDVWLRVSPEGWGEANESARVLGYTYFTHLCGMDWLPSPFGRYENAVEDDPMDSMPVTDPSEIIWGYTGGSSRFQVMTRLFDPERHLSVNLRVDVPPETMTVDTITKVYAGSAWHERECWEMFGIGFEGHKGLRHLYLPTEFEGFPLRKDFPLVARIVKPWPGIVDVESMPEVPEIEVPEVQAAEIAPPEPEALSPASADDAAVDGGAASGDQTTAEGDPS